MQPGEIVAGRFRIEAAAGRGGMATVYRASDLRDGSAAALKQIALQEGDDGKRFLREVQLLQRLVHPGLVGYRAHGMARDRFDGDDVVKVKRRIAEAVERARTTSEPTLVEVVTYRFRGHSMSDPGLYRTKEEVEEYKKRDCIVIVKSHMQRYGITEDEISAIDQDVKNEIEDAVKFADESQVLPAERLEEFNYVD